jgi:hypothetical protein
MTRWGLRVAVVGLVWTTGTASAGDEPNTLTTVVEELQRGVAADAAAVDALAAANDLEGWTAARERYLDRLEVARKTLEEAAAAATLSPRADQAVPVARAARLSSRIADARLGYRVASERAAKGDAVARKEGFAELRGNAGMAAIILELGLDGMVTRGMQIAESVDNLRTLVLYFLGAEFGLSKPWPPYSGKRLILWLVATNRIDRHNPQNLEILFSAADRTRSVEKAGGPEAFARITLPALQDPTVDIAPFTSYAGRANADAAHKLTRAELEEGAPLFADLSFGDVAIVAFTGGVVKTLTKKELGLAESDPIVVGPTSKSEILRHLSDK